MEIKKSQVLVFIRGGVASIEADPEVDVVVFDMDDFQDDPENTCKVPASFAEKAKALSIPKRAIEKE